MLIGGGGGIPTVGRLDSFTGEGFESHPINKGNNRNNKMKRI
jgi:hypothetical protein